MDSTPPAGSDQPTPDWDKFPRLDDVITTADLDTKGEGKFAATYINWCRTAQLLREHAAGWQFELRTTLDSDGHETHVFRAPDGSGYLVGFFRAPTGSGFLDTPDFPQAIMDARPVLEADGKTPKLNKWGKPMMDANASIPWDEITARDVTDTHRRCMCTTAAAHFGLAWQIWAKEEIENPMREKESAPAPKAAPAKSVSSKKASNTPQDAERPAKAEELSILDKVKAELGPEFQAKGQEAINSWKSKFKGQFEKDYPNVDVSLINAGYIKTQEHFDMTKKFLANFEAKA